MFAPMRIHWCWARVAASSADWLQLSMRPSAPAMRMGQMKRMPWRLMVVTSTLMTASPG
jgi:hypothetical protein